MVDIGNHEESLRELSKTSLVNNVTIILCWSAAEAARYLELYKSYEHANAGAIRGTESKGYADKMVEFVTIPRSINKTDAVSLVSAFGSLKHAINARPEEIAVVSGWGEKKVRKWCTVVDEPFRTRKAARRGLTRKETTQDGEEEVDILDRALPLSRVPLRDMPTARERDNNNSPDPDSSTTPSAFQMRDPELDDDNDDDDAALLAAVFEDEARQKAQARRIQIEKEDELTSGVAAELARLRDKS
jgi:DNA excision repair protein ERCC-1